MELAMSIRRALANGSVLRAATLVSLIGGTALLATDDKVVAALTIGISVGVVAKLFATYAALFAAAVWTAADPAGPDPVRVPIERR
jgi:hypothetical protein